jgi:hypothetical protein
MTILAVTLTVESQLGYISDFIPQQLASGQGIAGFIGVWAIFTITQYYILALLNIIIKSRPRTRFIYYIHRVVTVAQYLLVVIIAFLILQMVLQKWKDRYKIKYYQWPLKRQMQ